MKKFSSILVIYLGLSVVIVNSNLPAALAFEKSSINFEQVRGEVISDNSGATFNKTRSSSAEGGGLSSASTTKLGGGSLDIVQSLKERKSNHVEGEILVKYKNNRINLETVSGRTAALNFNRVRSLEKKEDLRKNNISVLRIRDVKTVEQKIAELKNDPNVEYAQPNFQYYPTDINTNDTNRGLLWGLDNTGQSVNGVSGISNADINAPEAWAINEGTNSTTIVAVIDTGVAYNHPDLATNMWDGSACLDENGAPLNGCNHGYDYEDSDKTPLPTNNSHGSHVAGTIAAIKNNGTGIIGVAPNAKIMAVKSSLTTADNVKSVNFAKQNGAKIINASWIGPINDLLLRDAISNFSGLFVAAAGNSSLDHGVTAGYPCDYDLLNIICVAATDQNDALATFSDYGATSVDVGAPGTNILSTISDSSVMFESFNSVTKPNLPSGWTKTGNWGTFDLGGTFDKVLYGDFSHTPYINNANSFAVSPTLNLGGNTGGATFSFGTQCDTEYTTVDWRDYMQLEYSTDGTIFVPATDPFFGGDFLWDEAYLDLLSGDNNPAGRASFDFKNLRIPGQFLTDNFKFRFIWVTNSSNIPVGNYDGCFIDDIKITKFSDGSDEKYAYYPGTSMAAPHVAGLAALVWSTKPELSSASVKNVILNTGNSLAELIPKTVSGKRINAATALMSITPPIISGVNATSTLATSTAIIWTTDEPSTSKIKYSTTTPVASTVVMSTSSVTTHNLVLADLTASTTYYYYVESADIDGNIASSTEDTFMTDGVPLSLDVTAPVIALVGSSTINIFVGDTYTDLGATATDNIDGNITANIITVNLVSTSTPGVYIITYNVSDAAGNPAVQVTRTVNVSVTPVILSSIAITTPAAKLTYAVGDTLDTAGLVVTGTYSDASTAVVTPVVVTGFNSAVPAVGQVLTVTFGDKTTTYTVDIIAPSDFTAFNVAITSAQALHNGAVEGTAPGEYAAGSKAILQAAIDAANLITSAESQSVVNAVVTTLNNAVTVFNSSVIGDSDISALNAAIASAQAIDLAAVAGTAPGQYPASAKTTLEAAIASAQTVNASDDQLIVNAAVVTLNAAVAAFQATVIGPSDLSALSAAIASAQTLHDGVIEGTVPGNHVAGSKAIYQMAINNASLLTVSDDQTDIDTAVITLASATTVFSASVVGVTDLTPLTTAINSAQSLHDGATEGTTPGEYAVGSKIILQTAIDTASLITSSEDQSVVNAAVVTLNSAVIVFSTQIIVGISSESNETPGTNSVTITWTTTHPATSRVVYDTVSHNPVTDPAPNYGYANSTVEDATLVTNHSVMVIGLTPATSYFFRSVSHGSPETYGDEIAVSTSAIPPPPPSGGAGGGSGGSGTITVTAPTSPALVINTQSTGGSSITTATSTSVIGEVLGVATYNFTRTLALGSRGEDVTELQNRLTKEVVYAGPITGYFGVLTQAGVKSFQKKHGLEQVGIVGPKTRAILSGGSVLGVSTGASPSSSSTQNNSIAQQIQVLFAKLAELQVKLKTIQSQ